MCALEGQTARKFTILYYFLQDFSALDDDLDEAQIDYGTGWRCFLQKEEDSINESKKEERAAIFGDSATRTNSDRLRVPVEPQQFGACN